MSEKEAAVFQTLKTAIEKHQAGLLQEAENIYRLILKDQPDQPDANHNLGVLRMQNGNPENALSFFQMALAANPNHQQYHLSYTNALIKAGKQQSASIPENTENRNGKRSEADRRSEKTWETKNESAGFERQANGKKSKKRKNKKNRKDYHKASSLNQRRNNAPKQEEVNAIVGLLNEGRLKDAETAARQLTTRFSAHVFGWKALGKVLFEQGRNQEGVAALEKAKAISPCEFGILDTISIYLHELGRLDQAVENYDRVIEIKPEYEKAHNNKGLALKDLGRTGEALECYNRALELRPDYAEAHNNKGLALKDLGRTDEAMNCYNRALEIKPDYAEAHNDKANALKDLGRTEEALNCYNRALKIKPDYAEAHNNKANALKDLGRTDEAMNCYNRALKIKPALAGAHNNKANALKDLGRTDEALDCYNRALEIKPNFAEAYNNKGSLLQELGRLEDALKSCNSALEIKPAFAEAYNNKAHILQALDRLEDARDCFDRALALKPDSANTYEMLIEFYKRRNQMTELAETLVAAREAVPGHFCIPYGEAILLEQERSHEAAKHCIQTIDFENMPDKQKLKFFFMQAKLCDRLGEHGEAFRLFKMANRLTAKSPSAQRVNKDNYIIFIDSLIDKFTASWVSDWEKPETDDEEKGPVFLVGFPRSGTTLLDTVLRSHPEVEVVEEKPAVDKIIEELAKLPGGFPQSLSRLDANQRTQLRSIYFRKLNNYVEKQELLIVDKFPLNSTKAGIIQRIFPNARFIFAQRHPCDCVLSCFMQSFKLNNAMANFLDLGDAARFYDKVLTLWSRCRELLNLRVHTVVYENLVSDFDGTIVPLLKFLNLDWDPALLDYRTTALKRGKINTPSYNQVTQPLYTHAKGRWENYREQMAPVLPTLLPWAERLGYSV